MFHCEKKKGLKRPILVTCKLVVLFGRVKYARPSFLNGVVNKHKIQLTNGVVGIVKILFQ